MTSRSAARIVATAALGIGLVLGGAGVANAMPTAVQAGHGTVRPTAQKYFWEWSDGYEKLSRTFKQADYGSQGLLPHLVVSVEPASPKRSVSLKYYEDNKWNTESTKKTNSAGKASLDFNPWCDSEHTNWCDGSWKYKVTVSDVSKSFTIKFVGK
jgi:hypothetical protein